jgi:hypothetical protein
VAVNDKREKRMMHVLSFSGNLPLSHHHHRQTNSPFLTLIIPIQMTYLNLFCDYVFLYERHLLQTTPQVALASIGFAFDDDFHWCNRKYNTVRRVENRHGNKKQWKKGDVVAISKNRFRFELIVLTMEKNEQKTMCLPFHHSQRNITNV